MKGKKRFTLLAINPGSTSTKLGLFQNNVALLTETITHDVKELRRFSTIMDQKEYRKKMVLHHLQIRNVDIKKLSAVVARGGLLKPLKSGTYAVNKRMIKDLTDAKRGEHASNLGACIAYAIARPLKIPAFIVDPVSVDEMEEVARISGLDNINRVSLSHALNTKAVAKRHAKERGQKYSKLNLIVAHLGSGISISAHRRGKMIDVANPREEGPFSIERSGTVPLLSLIQWCFDRNMTFKEMERKIFSEGGIYSYLGTKDLKKVREMIKRGSKKPKLILDAMVYQISKEIGAMATVLRGKVDAIIITGGIAHDASLVKDIRRRISFITDIVVYPGEDETKALAEGAYRILLGEEKAQRY